MDFASKTQALLFAEGDSLSLKKLALLLDCDGATLSAALDALSAQLAGSALTLVRTDTEAALAVAPGARSVVASAAKAEEKDIGEAGLEVLAILLYEGPSTRSDIDYIRGVNSSSTLRTLLSRNLVERAGNPEDGREYLYRPTIELLGHLGASNANELPEYATIARELGAFKSRNELFNGTGEDSGNASASSPAAGE